jgi:hypothetical protein
MSMAEAIWIWSSTGAGEQTRLCGWVDAKDRVVLRDRLEGGDRRVIGDREVFAATRCDLAPGFENWCSFPGRDFGEYGGARSAALDTHLPARRANVLHPFRIFAKHRNNVATAFVAGTNEDR